MNVTYFITILFVYLLKQADCIKCYECFVVSHPDIAVDKSAHKLCKDFDYSSGFVRECKNSTFCTKSIIKTNMLGPKIEVERGCAKQIYSFMSYKNNQWYNEYKIIEDAYKDGCYNLNNQKKSVSVENCYCKSDLCNSSLTLMPHLYSYLWIIIFFINI